MNLDRGNDGVWRQQRNSEPLGSSPEDLMIAAEEAKEREERITRASEQVERPATGISEPEEAGEKTLEGKSE